MANNVTSYEGVSHEAMLPRAFQRDRCRTDVFYSYLFGLLLLVFIGISIYAYVEYDGRYFITSIKYYRDYNEFTKITGSSMYAPLLYLLFFCCFLTLLRWAPKVLIYLASIMLYINIIAVVLLWNFFAFMILSGRLKQYPESTMLQLSVGEQRLVMQYTDFWSFFVVPVLSLIILIPTAICLQKEGVKVFSQILKKSCSALACFHSIRNFLLFILCYCMAVIVEILILLFKMSMDYRENLKGTLLYACIFIGKFYIYSFLYHFGVAVISNTIASWHYSQDNEEIPSKSLWRSIKIVCRFHLGTVALGASVIPPYFLAIYSACRHTTTKRSGNTVVVQIFKLFLILEITNFAVIQTSVHGYNFVKSTKRSFDLMVKNYSISMVVIKLFELVLTMMVFTSIKFSAFLITASGMTERYSNRDIDEVYNYEMIIIKIAETLSLPVIMIVGTAVKTTLIYTLEKQEFVDKSTEINTFQPTAPQNENAV